MEARELIIGNWVLLDNPNNRPNDTGEIHKVCGISENSVHLIKVNNNPYQDSYGQFLKYIKPIHLTEEILLKCGFEFDTINTYGNLIMPLSIKCRDGHFDYLYIKERQESVKIRSIRDVEIKYIHQLQNIYFALTGEELQINL